MFGNLKNLAKGFSASKLGGQVAAAYKKNPSSFYSSAFHVGSLAFGLSQIQSTDPNERLRQGVREVVTAGIGLAHPGAMGFLLTAGVGLAFSAGDAGRGVVQGLRGGLEARTMMHVPFSYSTVNMQQASQSMQYASSSMGKAYSTLGSEAAIFAARYMGA